MIWLPGPADFDQQVRHDRGVTCAGSAKKLAGQHWTTLGQARAMDGAGRLDRSVRSLRPQADLKAAAIGAVVLLRERLGRRARVPARPVIDREPTNRLVRLVERYLPRRAGLALTVLMLARQHRPRHRQGRSSRRIYGGGQRYAQRAGQFRRVPHHHGRHQRPQAFEPGRGARDRRRQRPLLAVVPRRRHRARQAEGQSLDRGRHHSEALSRPAADRHRRAHGVCAVAAGRPAGSDLGGRRRAGALCVAPLRDAAAGGGEGRRCPRA